MIDTLLRACPQLRVLGTSREALGTAGEVPWRVPSLTMPPEDVEMDALDDYEVVQLFVAEQDGPNATRLATFRFVVNVT